MDEVDRWLARCPFAGERRRFDVAGKERRWDQQQ